MDTTDKFINNKAPGRITFLYLILLVLSFAGSCFLSQYCAERITEDHISYVIAAAGGSTDFSSFPDDEEISAGEKISGQYGLLRDTDPSYLDFFYQVRKKVFICLFLSRCNDSAYESLLRYGKTEQ